MEDLLRCYAPQAAARSIRLPLLRLFTNLLVNAIRHSPEGGSVSLLVQRVGRLIRVTVADEGPGIPLQDQERMFERFWSGADRGGQSGLGLAIGRAIALGQDLVVAVQPGGMLNTVLPEGYVSRHYFAG